MRQNSYKLQRKKLVRRNLNIWIIKKKKYKVKKLALRIEITQKKFQLAETTLANALRWYESGREHWRDWLWASAVETKILPWSSQFHIQINFLVRTDLLSCLAQWPSDRKSLWDSWLLQLWRHTRIPLVAYFCRCTSARRRSWRNPFIRRFHM